MRTRAIIGTVAAAILAGGGTALIPLTASAQAAAPAGTVHTLKFVSVTERQINFSDAVGFADNDVNAKGKLIGFDTIYGTVDPQTNVLTGNFTAVLSGGVLYATARGAASGSTYKGPVTGGLGMFKDAKGTIVAKNLDPSGNRTAVTISYTISGS